jgi:tetratricopeptide (TPR) repeat protein
MERHMFLTRIPLIMAYMVVVFMVFFVGCMSARETYPDGGHNLYDVKSSSAQGQALAHYLAAVYHENTGNRDQARAEMAQVVPLDPEAITPMLQLVRSYLQIDDFETALAMCQQAVALRPERTNLWIVQGDIFHRLERYEEAMESFQHAIKLSPNNLLGYSALAEIQENTNDLIAAIDVYRQLIALSPDSVQLHYQLGLTLYRIKHLEEAKQALQRTLELEPNLSRARYFLGVIHLELEELPQCVAHLQHYRSQRPNDAEATECLAGALVQMGQDEKAKKLVAEILTGNQAQPQHHLSGMYLLLKTGEAKAVEHLAPAEGAPLFATLFTALARQAQGLPYLPLVKSLETIDSDLDAECSAYLSHLLYLFGKEETGQWILERLAGLDTAEFASAHLAVIRGRTLLLMERHEEAIEVLEALVATPSEQTEALSNHPQKWLHYYLAVANEELDRFDETEKHLQACLDHDPEEHDVLNFLAYLYAERGINLDKAEALLTQALALSPDNPYYLDSLGWVYYRQGRADEAVDYIRRAIYGMDTDDAILRDHLGDAYLLQGDEERAVAEWERAFRLDPALEGIEEKLRNHQ